MASRPRRWRSSSAAATTSSPSTTTTSLAAHSSSGSSTAATSWRATRAATARRWASDAEDLGARQLGQRQEGAVGGGGARPQVPAHRRRHGAWRQYDAGIPPHEPDRAGPHPRRRRLHAVGVAHDRALSRRQAWRRDALAYGPEG